MMVPRFPVPRFPPPPCKMVSCFPVPRFQSSLIRNIANCTVGCNTGNMSVNILAYAYDIVLLSPSWRGLQLLIDTLFLCVKDINMLCNGRKTVCMVVNPRRRSALVRAVFPSFKLGTIDLQFVPTFRYLGHIVTESLCDYEDIRREIKNLFIRTNSLVRKFSKCSFMVKCGRNIR